MWAIYKKETGAFFRSMTGYLYIAFLLVVSGVYFTAFNLQGGMAEFGYVLGNTTVVLLIVIPVLTMRTLGEEQRQRTDQLLFTAPVGIPGIVLGKFLAVFTVFAAPLAVLLFCPLVLSLYGPVLLGQSYGCFAAFLFMGAACIAVGMFVSGLTDNQILAAVGTFAVLLFSYLAHGISGLAGAGNSGLAEAFSLFRRYYDFVDGVFDVTHLVYYLGVTALFLYLTVQSVDRRFHKGLYGPVMCGLVLAIVVLSSLIAGKLPVQYTKLDISSDRIYTLSPQTRQVAEGLTSRVGLYLVAPAGKEDQRLVRLLEQYQSLSGNIFTEQVDPLADPGFVAAYTTDKVSDNSILVVGKERFRLVGNARLYPSSYDYDTGRITTVFDGEGQITGAIHRVVSQSVSRIYLVTGHGETGLSEEMEGALDKEGIEYRPLNLTAAGQIPQDAGAVWVNVPVTDLTEGEARILAGYLEQGGRMLLVTGISAVKLPWLDWVMEAYGLEAVQGMLVEGDGSRSIPSYPNFLLPAIREHVITQPFLETDGLLLLPNAHGIAKTGDVRSSVVREDLLVTSERAVLRRTTPGAEGPEKGGTAGTEGPESGGTAGTEGPENGGTAGAETAGQSRSRDSMGPFSVAVAASEQTVSGETRIAWFASSSFLMEEIDGMVGGNNRDLVLNTIGWMTGQDQGISIRPRTTSSPVLRLTAAQAARWCILFTAVIPVCILGTGIAVCVGRRRRQ